MRAVCYDIYWRGRDYRPGSVAQAKISLGDKRFRALLEGVQRTRPPQTSLLLMGKTGNGKAGAVVYKGYNTARPTDAELGPFENGGIVETIEIPRDCTPRLDPPTAEKERMMRAVVNTMKDDLLSQQITVGRVASEVTLTVADFNVDYQNTYVILEGSTPRVFEVALHDPNDYANTEYQLGDSYYAQEIYAKYHIDGLIPRIRKHGITITNVRIVP